MRKNLRKIPVPLLQKVSTFRKDDVVIACVRKVSPDDLATYAHLGLAADGARLTVPAAQIPPKNRGKYSTIKVEGLEIKRKDLPKIKKTFVMQAPNWNGSGTHSVYQDRLVYQVDFIRPKELEIVVTLLEQNVDGIWIVRFMIDQVLSRTSPDFEDETLYNLNLLHENVGAIDIYESDTPLADYIRTVQLDWEILPVGSVEDILPRIFGAKRKLTEDEKRSVEERLRVMARFSPIAYLAGTSGFLRYFGAKFREDVVAFENLSYGNALYVMYERWEQLSKRTRIDLLKSPAEGFTRIEHRKGWDKQFRELLRSKGIIV